MIRRLLSGVPFVLLCLSPDQGGGGGSSTEPKPAEPTGETLADKFENAKKIIGDYFKQLSGAMKEKDDAVSQVAGLNKQISDLTKERDDFKGQVSTITTEVAGLKDQVAGANDRATKAEDRTTLIESFAKHNGLDLAGLDKFKAVTEVPEAGGNKDGKALYEQWQALKKTSPAKASSFMKKHKAAIKDYADSLED